MTAPADPRLAAAADAFGGIALDLYVAATVIDDAIGSDDMNLVAAAAALVRRAGLLADAAAAELGQLLVDAPENWTFCAAARRALEQLGGSRDER